MKTEFTKQDYLKIELIGLKDMLEEMLETFNEDDETEKEINDIIEEFGMVIGEKLFPLVDNLCNDDETK